MRAFHSSCLAAVLCLSGILPASAVSPEAFAHNKKGIELAKENKLSEAIAEVKKAEQLDPGNADYHNNLSSLYTAQHRTVDALAEAKLAVKARPADPISNRNLGNLALVAGDNAAAEKAFRVVLKSSPKDPDALIGMTAILKAQNKLDEAEKMGRAAVLTTKGAGDSNLHVLLGGIFKQNKKYKDAIREYQTALNLDPNHPDAKNVQDQINWLNTQSEPIHK